MKGGGREREGGEKKNILKFILYYFYCNVKLQCLQILKLYC